MKSPKRVDVDQNDAEGAKSHITRYEPDTPSMPMRVGRRKYSVINKIIRTLEARRVDNEVDVYEFLAAVGNFLQF